MFASNMQILMINTNKESPTAQVSGGSQPIIEEMFNGENYESVGGSVRNAAAGSNHTSNKREQKHNKKKFVLQQQQQSQKYNNKNNNNASKLKNQHYTNSNSTSSLNRRKYYQQHHQQQQHYQQHQHQQYFTAIQQTNSTQTTTTFSNNNNSNLVKNQNYTNIDLLIQKQEDEQEQRLHTISKTVNNLVNHNSIKNITCSCPLSQSNCDKLSSSSCSSGSSSATLSSLPTSTGDCHQHQQLDAIYYDNQLQTSPLSLNTKILSSAAPETSSTACISCWSILAKLPQQEISSTCLNFGSKDTSSNSGKIVTSAVATEASKSNSDINLVPSSAFLSTTSTPRGDQLRLLTNTATLPSVSKKKSFWKNLNVSENRSNIGEDRSENSNSSPSSNTLSNTTSSPKLSKEKLLQQNHVSDKNLITNGSRNLVKNTINNNNDHVQKYSTTVAENVNNTNHQRQVSKAQVQAVGKIAMSTSLTTPSGSTSIKTSVTNNNNKNNNNTASSFSKTCSISPKQQQDTLEKCNDSKQILKTLSNTNSNSDINKITTTASSTSTPTSSVPSSPNSYTLDFLHSVGVKMTGVALRSSGIQGLTNSYGNQSATNLPVHSSYSYPGMTTNQRPPRYMYGGSNTNNSSSGNHQQHYHHHHQPSQLTIASFLHKDLLGGDNVLSNTNSGSSSAATSSYSSSSRNTNNYNDQQQQQHYPQQQSSNHTRYHHDYYTTPYQQQSAVMQHKNYGGGGGYAGELTRLTTNGSGGGQRNSSYAYTNYHSTAREAGIGKSNIIQHHSRHLQNNVGHFKNSLNNSQTNKKSSSYASSTTSTCSSSSSKSLSSNSSNISGRQMQTGTTQESSNSTSNLNLAIETLQSKSLGGGNQRGNHRGYHHNHHGHHHGNHHHHQHSMMNSPNVLQHQNYYNLTYVTTDGSARGGTSRGCSPAPQSLPSTSLPSANCHSPKSLDNSQSHVAMLMNFNASHLQYAPLYAHTQQQLAATQQQQFHSLPQQQQHQNFLNKKLLVPLTLNMPSPSSSPTTPPNTGGVSLSLQQAPPPLPNIICCSQLDEATTAAAAAAATSSSSSGIIADNDCDSDNSSNHSSNQIKYHSLKSVKSSVSSSSSSSSNSTTSLTGKQAQQQNCSQPTTQVTTGVVPTTLQSPVDFNYGPAAPPAFPSLQVPQPAQIQQFYGNNGGPVIPLLNLPTKSPSNYADEDYQQQQLQHQFYLNATPGPSSNDHLSIAAAANRSNNSTGYWSPSYHNNQFLYHQASTQVAMMMPNASSSSSCGSSSASISPRLQNEDIQQHNPQRLHNNCSIANASLSPSPCIPYLNEQLGNIVIGNSSNANCGILLAGSSSSSSSNASSIGGGSCNNNGNIVNSAGGGHTYKRSSSQLLLQQRLLAQQTYQSSSSSASSLSSSSASTLTSAVRARGGGGSGVESGINTNNIRNNQLPPQNSTSAVNSTIGDATISGIQQLPPTPAQIYSHQQLSSLPPPLPPHNLMYDNPQTHHVRALSSPLTSSSVHDYFTHTPPDRFLARAHLVEAKEAPINLLNNSKWDYLSQGIWKKFINSQQTEKTFKQKMHLWRYLYLFIKNAYPRYGLYLVGSTISGFGADSSDVDMCLVSRSASSIDPRMEALFNLTVLRDCLNKSGEFENFNLIEAKVPILRFCDRVHHLEVDLNFNNCVGIKNTHLLYCYSQLDWRLRPLVLVTKLWAQYHNINNAKNMTISSYSLVLMVIHFLQYAVNPPVLPCLHELFPDKFPLLRSNDFGYVDMNETIAPYDSKNTQTIGELFLLFLEYYSCFDYTQFAISVRTGGLLPINVCRTAKSLKNDIHQWKELCIEEPFDLTNTARSVYDYETFERVKAVFVASWRVLQETLDLNSVFSAIMLPSPCFESNNVLQNINPTTPNPTFTDFTESEVNAFNETKTCFEQYVNDFSVTNNTANKIYEENKSTIEQNSEEKVVNIESQATDEGVDDDSVTVANSSYVAQSSNRKLSKRKDLNRTLTPRQSKMLGEKEFPLTPSTSSPMPYANQTSTKNINRNNNNNNNKKTTTPMIS